MRLPIQFIASIIFTFLAYNQLWSQSISQEEFQRRIIGKWELREVYTNGYKQRISPEIQEFNSNHYFYKNSRNLTQKVQRWDFYTHNRVLLLTDSLSGTVTRFDVLIIRNDSLKIEQMSPTGARKMLFVKKEDQ